MPRDHIAHAIDQRGDRETEGLDAADELPDLLAAMRTGISRVELELGDRPIDNFEALRRRFAFGSEAWPAMMAHRTIPLILPGCRYPVDGLQAGITTLSPSQSVQEP